MVDGDLTRERKAQSHSFLFARDKWFEKLTRELGRRSWAAVNNFY